MIIKHFTDNDLYKFTTMNAIQKLYPNAVVKYKFINRGKTKFPEGFDVELCKEVQEMRNLKLSSDEEKFLRDKCYFFDPVYIDLLKGYRYDPSEVKIDLNDGDLKIEIEGYWYRTVLWEVPLMALISELYFRMTGQEPDDYLPRAQYKAGEFKKIGADYSEFGTRRRFSFEVQDKVLNELIQHSGDCLKGTSNVYLAMKYDVYPIGTHPHEWFMFNAAHYGYKMANSISVELWSEIYNGDLGIALTDTFTSDNFFKNFDTKHAKLFDGVRWDSGCPFEFTDKVLKFYPTKRVDPKSKTIVYSDSLDLQKVKDIKEYVNGRIHDVYGIGTYLTNDVGVKPLNMVIKLSDTKFTPEDVFRPTVKLSDVEGKHTGDPKEIETCIRLIK